MPPRIGITFGDSAGIGPEIVRAALASNRLLGSAQFQVIGEGSVSCPGEPSRETARGALAALEQAVDLAKRGALDAIVTGPIHKARMYEVGFAFPGQTEFFAARYGVTDYAMLLTGGSLTVALVTTHIPLRAVCSSLRTAEIVRVGRLLHAFLRQRHKRPPRMAVVGLNPHAGESGEMGREEIDIITPAIAQLAEEFRERAVIAGPFSPDTIFHQAAAGAWDGVLCMYHDQGLIPLKLHAFDQGVNVTLGLPVPRTSPDHGTAFEIAGQGMARPDSMIAAINLAAELARNA